MARPLRIDIPDGWYHVTSRGNERRDIFTDDRDRDHFVKLFAHLPDRFNARLHAYVLMNNHYHLLLQTPDANLSRAAQWLNVSYSVWFNRRHRRVGHLFQGRFKAIIIDPDTWPLGLSRYIHLNPVRLKRLKLDKTDQKLSRAGLADAPAPDLLKQRIDQLRAYRWSSYRAYIGSTAAPVWLTTTPVLQSLGAAPDAQRHAYREYVEESLRAGSEETPWQQLSAGVALGTAQFLTRLQSALKGNDREQPSLDKLRAKPTWPRIIAAVETIKGQKWNQFRDRRGDWGRDLALYLGRTRGGMTLNELAQAAGGIAYASAATAVKRFHQRSTQDPHIAALIKKAHQEMSNEQM